MIHARGRVELEGTSVLGRRPEQLAAAGIAHVPQGRGTIVDLSVDDNLRVGAYRRHGRDGLEADIGRWYTAFPALGRRRRQPAGGLSGGEQQMLAIARAMMARPKLVLLDEPSLGLAPLVTRQLFDMLHSLNQERGVSLLVVEQNANLALAIAARGYVLETGVIVTSGRADELAGNDEVRRAYLGA
jgi:branched-chain amino acid transport system ATP-binding protein